MTFLNAPTQPLLEIPTELQLEAWQNASSSAPAWWSTYLNQVCLQTVLPWLQSEYDATIRSEFNPRDRQNNWQLVNGTALISGSRRIIVIPDKTFDTSEFRVPQEWIDLPSWAGDYYLAAQVDPDDASILIWGYTTHRQLKQKGNYDPHDRTYRLDAHQMIQDLAAFGVVRELCPQEETRAEIAPFSVVSAVQAENLLQRLANPAVLQPRLEIPFQLWGALLEQSEWWQQLGQRRLGVVDRTGAIAHLGQWLQNAFEEGWQSLEPLFGAEPAYRFRQTENDRSTVQRVKVLQLGEHTLWLAVALEPEADQRVAIRVQLRSADPNRLLPSGISLTMLSESGSIVQSVTARDRDNGIQLNRFRCAIATQFSLQIAFDSMQVVENFSV